MVIYMSLQHLKLKKRVKWNVLKVSFAAFTAEASSKLEEKLPRFRTFEDNPLRHDASHLAKFYVIPPDTKSTIFYGGGISKEFESQLQCFRETAVMIRKPALEVINYLKIINYSHPAVRFVLYGENGVGKTSVLMHLVHYGYLAKYLLLHVPWASNWTKTPKEVVPSQSRPSRADIPVQSTTWLQHFKLQNLSLLKELDLKTSQTYTWSQRETTEAGQPLLDVIEHGLNRGRHSSDCIAVLLKEIKLQSSSGKFKTLVIVDGVNAFYFPLNKFMFKKPDKTVYEPKDITPVHAFEKVLKNDWNHAAVIVSVDTIIVNRDETIKVPFTPRSLLGKWGFETLDPFIPILVENYTEKEADSALDYYVDRLWLSSEEACSEKGRTELKFLSGRNPYKLREYCDSL